MFKAESKNHEYNGKLSDMESNAKILQPAETIKEEAVLLLSESGTKEFSCYLNHMCGILLSADAIAAHNLYVELMNRFSFDHGSALLLNGIEKWKRSLFDNDNYECESYTPENEAVWEEIQTVLREADPKTFNGKPTEAPISTDHGN